MQEGLKNLRPGRYGRHRRNRLATLLGLVKAWLAILPACLLVALGFIGGCGTTAESLLPAVDPLAGIPDNNQTQVLPSNSVTPVSGTVGTTITVRGQGRTFPAGYARFTFTGSASVEVEVPSATGEIRVKVPAGAQSGPFGFTIAGRSSGRDTSARIPSDSSLFRAYTVETPGFTVVPAPVLNNG
ncbi:MAG: hypothetical protein HY814_05305 [Candidatus Riflebacteria bacterium]|nr:hypothetical protein [Candidatus Riflebacteria bacterium]